ncbi:MAG: Uma2 family endonuclease [Planctomycetes bacterium]|nr:Uma2 family endonuclease [Planctomycetota bacterium]
MKKAVIQAPEIHYPESDGKPMAETDLHRRVMVDLLHALEEWFLKDDEVYVAGNLLLYYEEGNAKASCAPDVFVVRSVPKRLRRIYQVWKEGKGPDLVIEVTSRSTKWEDLRKKKAIYAMLGVKEYFLFDPYEDYLSPALQSYRLVAGKYVPMEPSSEGRMRSQVTGLELGLREGWLRLFDPVSRQWLLTPEEEARGRREEAQARRKEARARRAAEAMAREAAEAREKEAGARKAAEAMAREAAEAREKEAGGRKAAEAMAREAAEAREKEAEGRKAAEAMAREAAEAREKEAEGRKAAEAEARRLGQEVERLRGATKKRGP